MQVRIKKARILQSGVEVTFSHPQASGEASLIFPKPLSREIAREIFESTPKMEMDKMRGAK